MLSARWIANSSRSFNQRMVRATGRGPSGPIMGKERTPQGPLRYRVVRSCKLCFLRVVFDQLTERFIGKQMVGTQVVRFLSA